VKSRKPAVSFAVKSTSFDHTGRRESASASTAGRKIQRPRTGKWIESSSERTRYDKRAEREDGLITFTGDRVQFDLSRKDFDREPLVLLFTLGIAAGASYSEPSLCWEMLGLANRINEGNPNWTPYKIPKPPLSGWNISNG
jgi:hypothetical protein